MATQCGGPVNTHHFVSSSGYYGYVPPAQTAASAQSQQQQHQQPMINGHHQENGMDVDEVYDDRKMTMGQRMLMSNFGGRKRSFAGDELDIPQAYMPRFKRFREEAVVTNVFSMVQETASGQKSMDWPRCTMSRHYYA